MSLAIAQRGIDYSYARPSLAEARKAGSGFVVRYSAGAASAVGHPSHAINAGKLITPAEHKAILASGQDVIANDEWYESRITERVEHPVRGLQPLRGVEALLAAARMDLGAGVPLDHSDLLGYVSSAAKADATAAMALWRACGHAKGASIYVSWDAAPVTSKWPAVDAYLHTYEATLAGYYHVDCYAGTPYLKHALAAKLIRHGWRPNAGSWSNDGLPYQPDASTAAKRAALAKLAATKTPAAIWQTGSYWFSKSADENLLVRAAVGSHLQAATPPPAPKPTPPAPAPVHLGRNPAMIVCVVVKGTVPEGKSWPGWGTWDGTTWHHIEPAVTDPTTKKPVDNAANLRAACGQTAAAQISYSQWASWTGAQ